MTAQTVFPDGTGELPHARHRALTMTNPVGVPLSSDVSRRLAGAWLESATATVTVEPSVSTRTNAALWVCSRTFSTKVVTTICATGIHWGIAHSFNESPTKARDRRRLVRWDGSSTHARLRHGRGPAGANALHASSTVAN